MECGDGCPATFVEAALERVRQLQRRRLKSGLGELIAELVEVASGLEEFRCSLRRLFPEERLQVLLR